MAFVPMSSAVSQQVAADAPDAPAPEICGSDLVGFGKNAELTYDNLWANEPGYGIWVINKFTELVKEGEELDTPPAAGDTKIKRLAQWLIEKEKKCEAMGPQYEYTQEMDAILIPSSQPMKERFAGFKAATGPKFYGIAAPEKRVCTSWEECKPLVHGVKGVKYRSFPTREEAEAYIEEAGAKMLAKAAENEEGKKAKEAEREKKLAEKEAAKKQKEEEKAKKAEEKQKKAEKKTATRKSNKENADADAEGEDVASASVDVTALPAKKRQKRSDAPGDAGTESIGKDAPTLAVSAPSSAIDSKVTTKAKVKAKAKGKKGRKESLVMKDAEAAGLASALTNLAARPEVAGLGLPLDDLLSTLRACDGLVNKAKAQLLDTGVATPSKSKAFTASQQEMVSTGTISPEKVDQESSQLADHWNELKKLLAA